jgi:hypothetical protein
VGARSLLGRQLAQPEQVDRHGNWANSREPGREIGKIDGRVEIPLHDPRRGQEQKRKCLLVLRLARPPLPHKAFVLFFGKKPELLLKRRKIDFGWS